MMSVTTADVTTIAGSIVTQTVSTEALAATATTMMTTGIGIEDFVAIRSSGTVVIIGV
jgi:hypothetical protein